LDDLGEMPIGAKGIGFRQLELDGSADDGIARKVSPRSGDLRIGVVMQPQSTAPPSSWTCRL
jgi:hypothetical protein